MPVTEQEHGFSFPISPGDMDGDGIDDLVIGRDGFSDIARPGRYGAVEVYAGGGWTWSAATARALANASNSLGTRLF